MLSNGGNGVSRMDCALSQSMDSVNTVAAEEEVTFLFFLFFFFLFFCCFVGIDDDDDDSPKSLKGVKHFYKYS